MRKRTADQIELATNDAISNGWGKNPVDWNWLSDAINEFEGQGETGNVELLDALYALFESMHNNRLYKTEAQRAWETVRKEVRKNTEVRNELLNRGIHPDDFVQDTFLMMMGDPNFNWTSKGADSYIKRRVGWNCKSALKFTGMDRFIDRNNITNEVSDHEDPVHLRK